MHISSLLHYADLLNPRTQGLCIFTPITLNNNSKQELAVSK